MSWTCKRCGHANTPTNPTCAKCGNGHAVRAFVAACAVVVLATGCAGLAQPNAARYVTWEKVPVDRIEAVCTRIMSGKAPEGTRWRGCAYMLPNGNCTIYAPDFTSPRDFIWTSNLGHELKHCFDGQWHP